MQGRETDATALGYKGAGGLRPPRLGQGSVALSLCTTAHPLYTRISLTYSMPLFLKRRCDRTPGWGPREYGFVQATMGPPDPERERHRVGPEIGPTSAFSSYTPTGMHGPTCILWANLTHFSLAGLVKMGDGWVVGEGLGRTVALCHRSSTTYWIREHNRHLCF